MDRPVALAGRLPDVCDQSVSWGIDLPATLAARIRSLAAESADGRETGGILLGNGPDADGIIRVRHVGAAGSNAQRRGDFFQRDLDYARSFAAAAFLTDGSEWIGEWHTHPVGGAQPSARDLQTYATILSTTLAFEVLLSLIVTPTPNGWSDADLNVWLLST